MVEKTVIYIAMGICFLILMLSIYSFRRWRGRKRSAMPFFVGALVIIVGSYLFWFINRPLPVNDRRTLFKGVEYSREVLTGPVIVHVVRVDLNAAGIGFLVTPTEPTKGWELAGQTTSEFLENHQLQIAINGDFFDPWRDYGVWDYYPHIGDGINVRGLAASLGDVYTHGYTPAENYNTLYISKNNEISFNYPIGNIYNAISGNMMLLEEGIPQPIDDVNDYLSQAHPRTAVALDQSGKKLILVIVDGRQPNYSEGVTIPQLQQIVLDHSGYTALNLDGGGSVTLAVEGENGEPVILNSPIHNHIPGRERPIANHLGIYATLLNQVN